MPCISCVDKLAYRLMSNHKIDMIRAYELAEKGIERHEATETRMFPVEIRSGNPTDYTQNCISPLNMPCPDASIFCEVHAECRQGTCPLGQCPPPIANSHLETGCSSAGVITTTCVFCSINRCRTVGKCSYNGTCGYECNVGYVWNPVTLTCDLIPVAKDIIGDGIVFATL